MKRTSPLSQIYEHIFMTCCCIVNICRTPNKMHGGWHLIQTLSLVTGQAKSSTTCKILQGPCSGAVMSTAPGCTPGAQPPAWAAATLHLNTGVWLALSRSPGWWQPHWLMSTPNLQLLLPRKWNAMLERSIPKAPARNHCSTLEALDWICSVLEHATKFFCWKT